MLATETETTVKLSREDRQYVEWLQRKTPRIPYTEEWKALVDKLLAKYRYSRREASLAAGIDTTGTTLGRLAPTDPRKDPYWEYVEVNTIERIAAHLGLEDEVQERIDEILGTGGDPNWSPDTPYCLGCGTWFHPHHQDGLCEDCCDVAIYGGEPRDVRLSRNRIRRHSRFGYERV